MHWYDWLILIVISALTGLMLYTSQAKGINR